ncbi:acyl-homoserine-lactone synthase [Oricola sp.]|uniref:acyl-homoserine-lactone synthase n=1 Tax=Oricola sp. TaxID=1979950 RepID=UPI003517913C|tara:strand:+ start:3329 stop:4030 length:702 start_codon:yes stop_codon:yes gene_type:complete
MFFLIQATDYNRHRHLLDQMYRLRKRVFHDELEWDVPVFGDHERDSYDDMKPAYLLWTDEQKTTLYGSLRLLPTTGPTLLNDVFRKTYPKDVDLCHPTIWEGTRMCIDAEEIASDMPEIDPQDAMCMMLMALAECALDNSIHTLVSNYEPHMKRIYNRAGAPLNEIGKADGFGRRPVCCGLFEVSRRTIEAMREKTGHTGIYARDGARRPAAPKRAWIPGASSSERVNWVGAA